MLTPTFKIDFNFQFIPQLQSWNLDVKRILDLGPGTGGKITLYLDKKIIHTGDWIVAFALGLADAILESKDKKVADLKFWDNPEMVRITFLGEDVTVEYGWENNVDDLPRIEGSVTVNKEEFFKESSRFISSVIQQLLEINKQLRDHEVLKMLIEKESQIKSMADIFK